MENLNTRIMYCVLFFQNQLSLYTLVYCYLMKPYLFNLFWGRFENFKFYAEEIWTGFATLRPGTALLVRAPGVITPPPTISMLVSMYTNIQGEIEGTCG
jgi:hypothetical protein